MYIQCTLIFCLLRQFIFVCFFPHFKIIILIVKKIHQNQTDIFTTMCILNFDSFYSRLSLLPLFT